MPFYAYMLRCSDGSIYSGYARDVHARLAQHNLGKGAKYTRSRLPVELAYFEQFSSRQEAMQREAEFKHLSRSEKLRLIEAASRR